MFLELPKSLNLNYGDMAVVTFNCTASNSPVTYRWFRNNQLLTVSETDVSGVVSPVLSVNVTGPEGAGTYRCQVFEGISATSVEANIQCRLSTLFWGISASALFLVMCSFTIHDTLSTEQHCCC